MLKTDRFARQGAPNALPKLHGRKRGHEALLCRVRVATARALLSMRFRERAFRELLRWLRQTDKRACCSTSDRPIIPTSHGCSRAPAAHGDVLRSRRLDSTLGTP